MKTLSKSLFLISLIAPSCSDTATTSLTQAAMRGDDDAMKQLEEQTARVATQVKEEAKTKAAGGDEKAQVSSAWLNGGEEAVLKLAQANNSQALFELGRQYNSQSGAEQAKGRDWLIKAADLGHAQAMFLVGKHGLHGLTGFEADPTVGRDYLERATELGHAEAAFALGVSLRHGLGLPEDKAAALEYYRQADKGGFKGAGDELRSLTKELAEG